MKKLILSAALVLGSLTTFAQEATTTAAKTAPQETTQTAYKEITSAEVPEAVKTALTKAYPTATIDKAFVNDLKEYKLEVTVGDKKGSLFADEKGNWIKK